MKGMEYRGLWQGVFAGRGMNVKVGCFVSAGIC